MQTRTLSPAEERSLSEVQKVYLHNHPTVVSLQPHMPASSALYRTLRHGAVTIDAAMELDAIHDRYASRRSSELQTSPLMDDYSNAEDSFIDQHSMSSGLS